MRIEYQSQTDGDGNWTVRDDNGGGMPSANADSDDLGISSSIFDDDDGVLFGDISPGLTAGINSDLQDASYAKVDAWIDFNGDGKWDGASEQILTNHSINSGLQTINYNVPANAASGISYARVRVSSLGNLSPVGPAGDGEVDTNEIVTAIAINRDDSSGSTLPTATEMSAWLTWPNSAADSEANVLY